jgi:hypothetical protein
VVHSGGELKLVGVHNIIHVLSLQSQQIRIQIAKYLKLGFGVLGLEQGREGVGIPGVLVAGEDLGGPVVSSCGEKERPRE